MTESQVKFHILWKLFQIKKLPPVDNPIIDVIMSHCCPKHVGTGQNDCQPFQEFASLKSSTQIVHCLTQSRLSQDCDLTGAEHSQHS